MTQGVKPTQTQIETLRKDRRERKREQMNKIKFPIVNASWKDLSPFIISFILAVVLTSFISCSATLTTVGFDENKQYFSPKSIMIHDGQQEAVILMGPFKLDRFIEIRDVYKDCKWLVMKNQVHIYCKSMAPTNYASDIEVPVGIPRGEKRDYIDISGGTKSAWHADYNRATIKNKTFKDRGFGNVNHNAPGHVCTEECH